jgi:hypothetical protein
MNHVETLKLTQWRKTFKIFKSSRMQSLNIFEFTCLSGVWKFENYLTGPGPHVSGLCAFDRPGRSPGPTRHPCSQWLCSPHRERSVPVATGHRHRPELPPLTTAPVVTEEATAHFAFTCPPPLVRPCSSLLCSTLATASPIADELPRAVRLGQKERLVTVPLLHPESTCSAG